MVLQAVIGFLYSLVEQSWIVASIGVKYFLVFAVGKTLNDKGFDPSYFLELLEAYSEEVLTIIVFFGLVNVLAGLELSPLFKPFSQIIAFLYLTYLFWKY